MPEVRIGLGLAQPMNDSNENEILQIRIKTAEARTILISALGHALQHAPKTNKVTYNRNKFKSKKFRIST